MHTTCAVLGVRYVSRWQWTTKKSGSSMRTVPREILRVGTWIVRTSRLMCRCYCLLDPSYDMLGVNSHPVLRRGGAFVAPSEIHIKIFSIPCKHISTNIFVLAYNAPVLRTSLSCRRNRHDLCIPKLSLHML